MSTEPIVTGFTPVIFIGTVAEIVTTDSEGKPLLTKKAKRPYCRVVLRSSDRMNQSVSFLVWGADAGAKVGDLVEAVVDPNAYESDGNVRISWNLRVMRHLDPAGALVI